MNNKSILQENNTLLDGYILRINAAKDVIAELPDESSGSGTTVATREISVKTKQTPMPSSPFFVEYIDYVSIDTDGALTTSRFSNIVYMTFLDGVAIGTILFVKTINSPSSCVVDSDYMELVSFDASVGAVIKVIGDATEDGMSITFS